LQLVLQSDGREVVVQLVLLFHPDVLGIQALIVNRLLCLLQSLLDAGLHPVPVVLGGPHVLVLQLLLDVLPDLPILQVGIQLDDLHFLLLLRAQLV